MTQFTDLGLARPILTALSEERHDTPTPIQAQAIPPVLEGHDLLGIAQTGTGKTAAFALPILNHLDKARAAVRGKSCRVLVLSPTRELCGQIEERFRAYGKHMPLKTALIIGGVPIGRQKRAVEKGADVVVATPGRLLDLVEQRALSISEVEILVLDEADQMLDMGFIHAIRQIVAKLPKQRQNLFFSATMPKAIAELAGAILSNPVEVAVTPVAKTADRVDQEVMFVDTAKKTDALVHVLANRGVRQALVFTRTKHGADKVVKNLSRSGVPAEAIHGNKSQGQRERTLSSFRGGKINVLVATDIAARGIDVASVSHVINYDLPHVAETYVHRIGRTARNGADGNAITLCAPDEANLLRGVERLIKQKVPVIAAPEGLEATGRFDDGEKAQPGGRNKKRPPRRKGPRPNGQGGNPQQARSNDTAGGASTGDTYSKPKRPARGRPGGPAAPASPKAERKEHGQGRPDRVRGSRNGSAPGRKLSRAAG